VKHGYPVSHVIRLSALNDFFVSAPAVTSSFVLSYLCRLADVMGPSPVSSRRPWSVHVALFCKRKSLWQHNMTFKQVPLPRKSGPRRLDQSGYPPFAEARNQDVEVLRPGICKFNVRYQLVNLTLFCHSSSHIDVSDLSMEDCQRQNYFYECCVTGVDA